MTKTALITGAARRIGKAIASHLADAGWNVAIHYSSSETEANALCSQLRAKHPRQQFDIFKADLENSLEAEMLLPKVRMSFPKIDLLVNNASVFEPGRISESTTQFLERQMNVNFVAPFILSREFAQSFHSGVIINMADTRIGRNASNFAAYTLSKKALWELTKMAALEFGPAIRVNAVAPGLAIAPEEKSDAYLWKLAEKIPMKRPGGIDPILKSLDYILANEYLTGQLLFCDGGENLV
jgi:NAD(P)-dependent dehydrogenase (short-subunit alcohol dehydrogenase family)